MLAESTTEIKQDLLQLLRENNLPDHDLTQDTILFSWIENNRLVGCVGLELLPPYAVLRSLSVSRSDQARGTGSAIVKELEEKAKSLNVSQLFLLTETAEGFFTKAGYQRIDRTTVPPAILNSVQFRSTCPSSATVMTKHL
jgi:amino-acid N-acetyltransferase